MRAMPLIVVVLGLLTSGAVADQPSKCRPGSRLMARADLFFGAGGSTRADWKWFLATVVTPRFPDGLTSLDGTGQWLGPSGIAREPAHLLIILYDPSVTNEERLEEVRTLYKRRFAQKSVLRVDSTACASF